MTGKDCSGKKLLTTHLGTESYMAPEIHEHKEYDGKTIDLFALGVILFIMKSQNPPFNVGSSKDP